VARVGTDLACVLGTMGKFEEEGYDDDDVGEGGVDD
jgi:hypothetical protein